MKIVALICYGWLASQSVFFLWMLSQIRAKSVLIAIEPKAAILNAELVITGLVLLVAVTMFVKERLSL